MAVLIGLGTLFAIVVLTVIRGWSLSILWAWFAVPAFGIAPLSIPMAIGLTMLANLVVASPRNDSDTNGMDATDKMVQGFIFSISLSLVALGSGWVVKQFI